MHILRKASLFIVPLLCLVAGLYFLNWWLNKQQSIKNAPQPIKVEQKIVKETKKNIVHKPALLATEIKKNDTSFFTVVLDPRHGGEEIGEIGYRGAVASNLNLQFSFRLAKALRMRGMKVYLTRTEDVNVEQSIRFKESVRVNPNIVLSIDCSFSDIKSLRGMELYAYTPDDEYGAVKEQEALFIEGRVARSIKNGLDLAYKSSLERKSLDFLALPSKVPALAIFIGYISNPDDVKQLEDEKYVNSLVDKMAIAIEKGLTTTL